MSDYHTHAAVVSTGDELVIGQMLDTNSKWIADRLTGLGIVTVEHVTVGDDRAAAAATLRRLAERVPLVITTGGLGPTMDDVMRDALAEAIGEGLVEDPRALARLEARFRASRREMTDNQRLQALRPPSAESLDNDHGTAPGLHGVVPVAGGERGRAAPAWRGCDVFCLPGPPVELRGMFETQVRPRLRLEPGRVVATRLVQVVGLSEGAAAASLGELLERGRDPLMGITASGGVLTLRIRSVGAGMGAEQAAEARIAAAERAARERLGVHVYGVDGETLAEAVVRRMKEQGRALTVVESCTGGMLGEMVTAVPGSSAAFRGGWITYSNAMKVAEVGVDPAMLAAHGAVSEPTARAMAVGGLEQAWAERAGAAAREAAGDGGQHSLAITGVAGPEGGSPDKPVGTVYIAHARRNAAAAGESGTHVDVRLFLIPGGRDEVRERSARAALAMLWFGLQGEAARGVRLLWEMERWTGPTA